MQRCNDRPAWRLSAFSRAGKIRSGPSCARGRLCRASSPANGGPLALALIGHSFMDGVGIGLAFQVSSAVGITVAIAVIAHDFCDGLNTVSLMLVHSNSARRSLTMLLFDALAPVLGAASTLAFRVPRRFSPSIWASLPDSCCILPHQTSCPKPIPGALLHRPRADHPDLSGSRLCFPCGPGYRLNWRAWHCEICAPKGN